MQSEVKYAVSVFATASDGEFLTLRNSASKCQKGMWVLPGGKPEPGESPEETAQREVGEEAGIQLYGLRRLGVTTSTCPDCQEVWEVTWFKARAASTRVILSAEHDKAAWVTFYNLPRPLSQPFWKDVLALLMGI